MSEIVIQREIGVLYVESMETVGKPAGRRAPIGKDAPTAFVPTFIPHAKLGKGADSED